MIAQLASLHLAYAVSAVMVGAILFGRLRVTPHFYRLKVEGGWLFAILCALPLGYLLDTRASALQWLCIGAALLCGGFFGWRTSAAKPIKIYMETQELEQQPTAKALYLTFLPYSAALAMSNNASFGVSGKLLADLLLVFAFSAFDAMMVESSFRALRTLAQPDEPAADNTAAR